MSIFVSNPIEINQMSPMESRKGEISIVLGRSQNRYCQPVPSAQQSKLQVVERTIEDEVLLTELALDRKDLIIYDISPSFNFREEEAFGQCQFKAFVDEQAQEMFLEIQESQKQYFTKSFFLQLCDVAELIGIKKIFSCVRYSESRSLEDVVESLLFIGFNQLSQSEQARITISKTHVFFNMDL